jgi:hypothetical protein
MHSSMACEHGPVLTASAGVAVIRVPLAMRIYTVVFAFLWCGWLTWLVVTAADDGKPASIVTALLFIAFGIAVCARISRAAVLLQSDVLVVRGQLRTRRISRAQIEGFRSGTTPPLSIGRVVYVLLRDGSLIMLEATAGLYRSARGRTLLADRVALLETWRTRS